MSVTRLPAVILLVVASQTWSQGYPERPVRMVTNGGTTDILSRLIAPGMAGSLGQPVIVDTRAANVSAAIVSKAIPDGYTLLHAGSSFWVGPLIEKTAYDPIRDFSPITLTAKSPNVLVVQMSLPIKSVADLIALAKAKSGALNYGSGGSGGSPHLAAELFKSMAGVNIVWVPYTAASARMTAIITNEVQMEFAPAGVVSPYVQTGKIKALAVTSAEPSPLFPGLPAIAASGLPGYEYLTMSGIFAPAKTPEKAVARLNTEIVRTLSNAETKDRFKNLASEALGSSPQEFVVRIKAETVRMTKLVKDAGIRAN